MHTNQFVLNTSVCLATLMTSTVQPLQLISSLPRHCLKVCAVGRRTLQRRALVIVFDAMTEANSVAPAML